MKSGSKLYWPSIARNRFDLMPALSGKLPAKSISAVVVWSRNFVSFYSEYNSYISNRNSLPEVI